MPIFLLDQQADVKPEKNSDRLCNYRLNLFNASLSCSSGRGLRPQRFPKKMPI
jgi:hypothetical protein